MRAATNSQSKRDRAVVSSSATASQKYCCFLSPDRSSSGSTAIEGLSGMGCTVGVGFAEVQEEKQLEKILTQAESMQNTLDEFCFF